MNKKTKKEIIAILIESIENRKKQKELINEALIEPINDVIKLGKEVLFGRKSLERYHHRSIKLSEYLQEFCKTIKKDKKLEENNGKNRDKHR